MGLIDVNKYAPIKFFVKNALLSFAASASFVALLLAIDLAGIRTLLFQSEVWPLLLFILILFLGITFSLIQFGLAVYDEAE